MSGATLPDSDHVARYCAPSFFDAGELQAAAFIRRKEKGEIDISVDWLEHLDPINRSAQIQALQRIFASKMRRVSTGAKFAVLNVGKARSTVRMETPNRVELVFKHDPQPDDQAHTGIFGTVNSEVEVADALLRTVINPLHPAK